jgi:hypothetical protein
VLNRSLVVLVLSACAPAPPAANPQPVVITSVKDPAVTPPKHEPAKSPVASDDSPRDAIKEFLRAYEEKNWNLLLDFVPEADRADLTSEKLKAAWEGPQAEEILRSTTAIRSALNDAPIDVTETRASMAYGAGRTILLVKEHGAWKVQDF